MTFLAASLFLAGCETTAGAGRDLEAAGDAIEDAAEDAQN
ncbi:MAG: entericidin A/B family lipoprotein [Opitutales bacterium]|nr:entericidin A/B family lipoprotein [Opitutales bacterium]